MMHLADDFARKGSTSFDHCYTPEQIDVLDTAKDLMEQRLADVNLDEQAQIEETMSLYERGCLESGDL